MELNIRIAGAAGQGIQTASNLLGKILTRSGLFAYCTNDAESRIRGGLNFNHIRCSEKPLTGVTNRIDILVALNQDALKALAPSLLPDSAVICEEGCTHPRTAPFNLATLAKEAGSEKASSAVAVAAISAIMGIEKPAVDEIVRERFEQKFEQVNLKAVALGYEAAAKWPEAKRFAIPQGDGVKGRLWISGGEAVALGAVAGGAKFIAAYPMSPSTVVMTMLAEWSHKAGIVVEQVEDEVSALNMVAGAWYAGARALTATSGGGFALMVEALSLTGMIESPAVIILAQRPGPSTGLPTRTAQGELNFARHAGHGYFARILLAPKNIPECFSLTAQAFDLAEKYQIPVFVMTDQLLMDAQATVAPFSVNDLPTSRHYLSPSELSAIETYRRYEPTDNGISPMAAPGVSKHVVVADSDEHSEEGHIVEAADAAELMASKRVRKGETVLAAAEPPVVDGKVNRKTLVVSWGSTYDTIREVKSILTAKKKDFAHLHLKWLWPLQEEPFKDIVSRASKVIAIENSVACDVASVIREIALRKPDAVITRRDGRPFDVETLVESLSREIK